MPRLIDADELVHVLEGQCMRTLEQGCHPRYTKGMKYAIDLVKREKIVDPVKHGHWEWNPDAYDWNLGAWVCSECGHYDSDLPREQHPRIPVERYAYSNYCHCCGAKMVDGGNDDV